LPTSIIHAGLAPQRTSAGAVTLPIRSVGIVRQLPGVGVRENYLSQDVLTPHAPLTAA